MQEIGLQMELKPVNQRLKFLLDTFKMSARTFSELIGEKASNTQNYVGSRNSMPGADYLEKVLNHFENVNSIWLLTGKGEPFTSQASEPAVNYQSQKKNKGTIIGSIAGGATFHTLTDCEKANASLRTENELLRSQLVDKEKLIRLLEASQPKP